MILIDTGAVYALSDKNDINHERASQFYKSVAGKKEFVILSPILVESWLLLEARLGNHVAQRFLQSIKDGVFVFREITLDEISRALEIEKKYDTVEFGFIDAVCFAFAENKKIREVFSFDQHFSIYRPSHTKYFIVYP